MLGSECLRLLTPETQRAIELLPSVLEQQLEEGQSKTLQFVDQLIADRMGLTVTPHAPAAKKPADAHPPGDLDALLDELPETDVDSLSDAQERDALNAAEHVSKEFEDWELGLLESAAAVTECYFRAKANNLHSVSRWSTDILRLDANDAGLKAVARASVLRLANILDERKKEQTRATQIAHDLSDSLGRDPGEISLASLEALTEIAWEIITRYFTIFSDYPEWPEFLVRLSLDHTRSRLIRQGPPRPALRSALDATDLIRDALIQQTIESARGYAEGQPPRESARVDAYAHFSDMLYEMARFRAKLLPGSSAYKPRQRGPAAPRSTAPKTPPPASAFVTTFDLELELALAHRHPEQPFAIAVPVNVIDNTEGDGDQRLASTMWLGCVIKPDPKKDLYSQIAEPPSNAWFTLGTLVTQDKGVDKPLAEGGEVTKLEDAALHLVRNSLPEDVKMLGELPLIVRLAGAPLIKLPRLQDADQTLTAIGRVVHEAADLPPLVSTANGASPTWQGRPNEAVAIRLVHATLLDEHNAIRLSLPEVLRDHPWGLPRDLTAPVTNRYWRYWMLLGVELSDPVIRYRVFSQILGAGLTSSQNPVLSASSQGYRRPKRAGVALNRKSMNARAIDLLLWSGFDIVRDGGAPAQVSGELTHWLKHLARLEESIVAALQSWPSEDQACQLITGAAPEGASV